MLTQILTMSPMLPELKPGGEYCVIFHIFLTINLLLVENQRKSVTWVILLALAALERRPLVRLTRLPVLLLKCWISWDKYHDALIAYSYCNDDISKKNDDKNIIKDESSTVGNLLVMF